MDFPDSTECYTLTTSSCLIRKRSFKTIRRSCIFLRPLCIRCIIYALFVWSWLTCALSSKIKSLPVSNECNYLISSNSSSGWNSMYNNMPLFSSLWQSLNKWCIFSFYNNGKWSRLGKPSFKIPRTLCRTIRQHDRICIGYLECFIFKHWSTIKRQRKSSSFVILLTT